MSILWPSLRPREGDPTEYEWPASVRVPEFSADGASSFRRDCSRGRRVSRCAGKVLGNARPPVRKSSQARKRVASLGSLETELGRGEFCPRHKSWTVQGADQTRLQRWRSQRRKWNAVFL